ncbi:MAG: hypothetical protein Q4G47_08650, partial [Lachnospiraceae bacterium]|nr:hypothetical protein [Lachnospiraceae bacterium]
MIALASLAIALAAGAMPFLFGTVYFMVADDYLINYIANGSYGWADSDHLIFLRMPIGKTLQLLYSLTTSVNWYFLMLMSVAVLSFAVLHACLYLRT